MNASTDPRLIVAFDFMEKLIALTKELTEQNKNLKEKIEKIERQFVKLEATETIFDLNFRLMEVEYDHQWMKDFVFLQHKEKK